MEVSVIQNKQIGVTVFNLDLILVSCKCRMKTLKVVMIGNTVRCLPTSSRLQPVTEILLDDIAFMPGRIGICKRIRIVNTRFCYKGSRMIT